MGSQIGAQPLLLRRAWRATSALAVAIEHNNMPRPEIIAVISFGWVSGHRSPIIEIPARISGHILVVPRGWLCTRFVSTPGRVIIICKSYVTAIGVREIS